MSALKKPQLGRLVVAPIIGLSIFLIGSAYGPPAIAPWTGAPEVAGFPPEFTCAHSPCHSSFPLNEDGQIEIVGVPEVYDPGTVYPITVLLNSQRTEEFPARRWGFELVAISTTTGNSAGTILTQSLKLTQKRTRDWGDRTYVSHDIESTHSGVSGPVSWSFDWQAPEGDTEVLFCAAGNAANGDSTTVGDHIYTAQCSTQVGDVPTRSLSWGGIKLQR